MRIDVGEWRAAEGYFGLDPGLVLPALERAARALGRLEAGLGGGAALERFWHTLSLIESCQIMHLRGALVRPEDVLLHAAGAGSYDDRAQLADGHAFYRQLAGWWRNPPVVPLTAPAIESLADHWVEGWRKTVRAPRPPVIEPPSPAPPPRSVLDQIDAVLEEQAAPAAPPVSPVRPQGPMDLAEWCQTRADGADGVLGLMTSLHALERGGWLGAAAWRLRPVLIPLLLRQAGLLPLPFPFAASGLRAAARRLGRRPTELGPSAAIAWDLEALALGAEKAWTRLTELQGFRHDWLARAGARRQGSLLPAVVELFVDVPVRSIGHVAESLGITGFGATRLVRQLENWGIVQEISGRKSFRFFAASALLRF